MSIELFMQTSEKMLLIVFPLLIILIGTIGYFMIKRALRQVDLICDEVENISYAWQGKEYVESYTVWWTIKISRTKSWSTLRWCYKNNIYSDIKYIYLIKRGAYAMPGILVVEDDENLNRGITFSLKNPDMRFFQQNQWKKQKELQVIIMWMLPFVMWIFRMGMDWNL